MNIFTVMMRFIIAVSCALLAGSEAVAQGTNPSPNASLARSLSAAFADVYEKVSPGVVVIEVEMADAQYPGGLYQFFNMNPRMMPMPQGGEEEMQQGSGFIMTQDGYILTNGHVLQGATANGVRVQLQDGRKFPARLIGVDPMSDLAVIKIDADSLVPAELGDSDKVRVGEFAFALGAPFDLRYTFTYGIISAKGRNDITDTGVYEDFLQTDASINPGNSGGPLVDIDGRVIGVNTLINGMNRGLGFAIPINMARKVAQQLITDGQAVRPWIGLNMLGEKYYEAIRAQRPGFPEGVFVRSVIGRTPAAMSGLRSEDVITAIDGVPIKSPHELQKAIYGKEVGQEVVLDVWRNNRITKVSLRTGEMKSNGMQPVSFSFPNVDDDTFQGLMDPTIPPQSQKSSADPVQPDADVTTASPATAGLVTKTMTADLAIAMQLKAEEGALVMHVEPGSPASVAGIEEGDVITSIDSKPVRSDEDVQSLLTNAQGDGVLVNFNRGTKPSYSILKF